MKFTIFKFFLILNFTVIVTCNFASSTDNGGIAGYISSGTHKKPIDKVADLIRRNEWQVLKNYFVNENQYTLFMNQLIDNKKVLSYTSPSLYAKMKAYTLLEINGHQKILLQDVDNGMKFELQFVFNSSGEEFTINSVEVVRNDAGLRITEVEPTVVTLPSLSGDYPSYYANYVDYYTQNQDGQNERIVEFRQINFDNLKISFKWCENILGIQVCGNKTKEIVLGPVISRNDVPDGDEYFRKITDITSFSQDFGSVEYLSKNYVQTAVIVDNGKKQLVFLREGLLPWNYGSVSGEYSFQEPFAVKEIGGYLYVLDKGYIVPRIAVLKLNHASDGTYSVNVVGTILNQNAISFSIPTDLGGFVGSSDNFLLVSDKYGVHTITLDKSTGFLKSGVNDKIFTIAQDPLDLYQSYSIDNVRRIDASKDADAAVLVTSDNKIISVTLSQFGPSNATSILNASYVNYIRREHDFSGIAYMVSEEKWYLTDLLGKMHNLSKNGQYLGVGGKPGKNEWNNELYEPIGITPNTITDPSNPYRYRFIVANKWDYTTGFKIFAPGITVPDAKVFENLTDGKLYFTFTTSGKWQAVENATGISFGGVKINGAGIGSSLWNTQIIPGTPSIPGNDLQAYPNVFTINPTDLNLKRGWNTVELSITVFKNGSDGNETVTKSIDFYWLPTTYTPSVTTGGQAKINFNPNIGGSLVDFIYKPITIGTQGSFYTNDHKVVISEKGKLTFNSGSTFFSKTTSSAALTNFYFAENSKFQVNAGAYICVNSGSSSSTNYHIPEIKRYLTLDPGYKLGTNPSTLPEYSGTTCTSPCYYYDQMIPAVNLNVTVDYASGPAFTVTADPAGTTYSNSVKWEVSKIVNGTATNTISKIVSGSAATVNLKTLLPCTFDPCSQYRVTLYITCNDVSGWVTYGSKDFSTAPVVDAGADQVMCADVANVTLTGFTPATGTWSGSGVSSAGLFTSTNVTKNTPLTLTYSYTDVHGCTRTDTKTMTVYSIPATATVSGAGSACAGTDINLVIAMGMASNATYSWYLPDNTLHGTSTSTSYKIPNATTTGSYGAKVTVNGCTGLKGTFGVTVRSLPTVTAGANQDVCNSTATLTMTGQTPTGGTWSGNPNITSAGVFSTTGLALGTYAVNYRYTDSYGCVNNATKNVVVGPIVTAGSLSEAVCMNAQAFTLIGQSPTGGSWIGTGVSSSGVFTPSVAGIYTLTYSFTDATGCIGRATKSVTVKPVQVQPAISGNSSVCTGEIFTLFPAEYTDGAEYQWTLPDNRLISSASFGTTAGSALSGTYKLKMYINGCSHTDFATKTLTVNSLPSTSEITGPAAVCRNTNNVIFSVVNSTGSAYTWTVPTGVTIMSGQGTNSISVNITDKVGIISVQEINANGCKGSLKEKSLNFTILPIGATQYNPIEIGKIYSCTPVYTKTVNNGPSNCYGNDYSSVNAGQTYGRATDDVYFRFELTYDSEIEAYLCGSSFDTYMHLLNEDGSLLKSNDDSTYCGAMGTPGYRHSYIKRALVKGKYLIVVEGYSGYGDIKVNLKNNTLPVGISRATAIDLGNLTSCQKKSVSGNNFATACFTNSYTGTNNQVSPEAYYKFTLSQASTINISMCGTWDTYLHLLDVNGANLLSDDDGNNCGGGTSKIVSNIAAGTYYIACEGFSSNTGDFNLEVVASDGSIPGGKFTNPIAIGDLTGCNKNYADSKNTGGSNCFVNTYSSTSGGQISNDVIYKFTLTGTGNSDIEISMCSPNFDTYLHLLNSSYGKITSDDDNKAGCSGSAYGSYIRQSLGAGTYYVVCEGYMNNYGDYTLNVKNMQAGCTTTCGRTYTSNTNMPATLGAFGSTTTLIGGGNFSGTYRVTGDLMLKEGTYLLNPGTKFYVESGVKISVGKNGKLELNGGVVTKACDVAWKGIVLDLNDPGVQGLEIKTYNNAEISYAETGIGSVITNMTVQPRLIEGVNSDRLRVNITNTQFISNKNPINIDETVSYAPMNYITGNTISGQHFNSMPSIGLHVTFSNVASENYTISNNSIRDCGDGIDAHGNMTLSSPPAAHNLTISNNNIIALNWGISMGAYSRQNSNIYNNYIQSQSNSTYFYGIDVAKFNSSVIEGNIIKYCGTGVSSSGVLLNDGINASVNSNNIENAGTGISINSTSIISILKNTVLNTTKGIRINSSIQSISPYCNTIINSVFSSTTTGIFIDMWNSPPSPIQLGTSLKGCGNRFTNIGTPVYYSGSGVFTYYKYNLPEDNAVVYGGNAVPVSVSSGTTLDQLCSNALLKESIVDQIAESGIDMNIVNAADANSSAYLGQNVPNPATSRSVIDYIVPSIIESAKISVFDVYRGNEIESFDINNGGSGRINVDLSKYATGTYIYTLYINDTPFDNKKMVIVK